MGVKVTDDQNLLQNSITINMNSSESYFQCPFIHIELHSNSYWKLRDFANLLQSADTMNNVSGNGIHARNSIHTHTNQCLSNWKTEKMFVSEFSDWNGCTVHASLCSQDPRARCYGCKSFPIKMKMFLGIAVCAHNNNIQCNAHKPYSMYIQVQWIFDFIAFSWLINILAVRVRL